MENPYAAPQGQILTPIGNQAPLTWKEILFSFEGRIPRRTFWGVLIGGNLLTSAVTYVLELSFDERTAAIASVALALPFIWVSFAIYAKRWHDRDKSGWWFFIILVPIIGVLWMLISCGFLRGTYGPNKYGEDPT
jgi:uncharacterized membrane protein YhaH (DUF805 family)